MLCGPLRAGNVDCYKGAKRKPARGIDLIMLAGEVQWTQRSTFGRAQFSPLEKLPQIMGEQNQLGSRETAEKPFGCVELWAGNERTHRHLELVGLEGDVISLPSGAREGGDLYALFSCAGEEAARIVLADCVCHGSVAPPIPPPPPPPLP